MQSRDTLGEDHWLIGEVLGEVFNHLMMVVEAYDIDSTALEQMVVGVDLVTTGRDGTGGVVALNYLSEMTGEQ